MRHPTFARLEVGVTLLLVSIGPAAAQDFCGATITRDTVLHQDLTCSRPITVSRATFNLNGHTITCGKNPTGVILGGARSELINGTVASCEIGVQLSSDGVVRDVTITTVGVGIDVQGSGNMIHNNFVSSTLMGIEVLAPNNRLIGNHLDGGSPRPANVHVGIALASDADPADSTTLMDNVVTQFYRGIEVFTDRNAIRANQLSANAVAVFVHDGAHSNSITGNTAAGNTEIDLVDENSGCDRNQWRGNGFDTANPTSCIH